MTLRSLLLFTVLVVVVVVGVVVADRCENGPYVIFSQCGQLGGIGSRVSVLQGQLSAALMLNLTLVSPLKSCYVVGHGVSRDALVEWLGWRREAAGCTCTAEDVFRLNRSRIDVASQWRKTDAKSAKDAALSFVSFRRLNADFDSAPLRQAVDVWRVLRNVASADSVFHIESESFPAFASGAAVAAMQTAYHSSLKARTRHRLSKGDTPPYMRRDPYSFLVVFHRRRDEQNIENRKYAARLQRTRLKHDSWWIAMIARVMDAVRAQLKGTPFRVEAALFSEGAPTEFAAIAAEFPWLRLELGDQHTVFDDLDQMINADLFVGLRSSFSRLVAQLSDSAILLLVDASLERFRVALGPRPDKRVHTLGINGRFNVTNVREGVRWLAAKLVRARNLTIPGLPPSNNQYSNDVNSLSADLE
jgi:hypothetical protein